MEIESFTKTPTGVLVADDFRSNLIIDRYDPIFSGMRAGKLKHMRSENSEDAVTWNVFRTLRQIQPIAWLPTLCSHGLPGHDLPKPDSVVVNLWRNVAPPPSLLELGDEGISEIDVVLENPQWVWFIEAKYHSDISAGTTTRPLRNQILRNIDVGSYYAGVRPFFFSLLVRNRERSPIGVSTVEQYSDIRVPQNELSGHRPDGLRNLQAVTLLTWAHLGAVLEQARTAVIREDEQGYADRAIAWLTKKGLHRVD